jgi:hypothetical protein
MTSSSSRSVESSSSIFLESFMYVFLLLCVGEESIGVFGVVELVVVKSCVVGD